MNKIICSVVILGVLLSGCTNKPMESLAIAEQYGIAYAPIQIAKELGFFQANLPKGTKIEYKKLANTAAIREAMLAGQLDVGFMGIPPFLIGSDKGMDWKIMTGLSSSPLGLVVNDPEIESIDDLVGEKKIALPQPGSIQHILLSMYAKKYLGNATIFDEQLIAMKHPDGFNALMNDPSVIAHFTSPPYLFQELSDPSNRILVSGEDAVGDSFTFIIGVCREDLFENKELYEGLKTAIRDAIEFMEKNPEETVKILAKVYELDEGTMKDYLYKRGMVYETSLSGVQVFIDFMFEEGYLENQIEEKEVRW